MSKKKKEENIIETNPLKTLASNLVDKGVVQILVLGLHENGVMEMSTSFDRYEDVHAILSRGQFEVNMAHAKAVVAAKEEVKSE